MFFFCSVELNGNLICICIVFGFENAKNEIKIGGVNKEMMKKMKYVLVTGGVVSGLGKGVTASSIGLLLKACNLRVTTIKIGLSLFLSSSSSSSSSSS